MSDDPVVIVCQGPPACRLEGDAAIEAQEAGCVWCRRITVHADGTETVTEPART
jgi:hypothetical protein